ncbi:MULTISPECIES: hypothetical protein [Pseudomonas]|uniref:Uncharacterized protein n=1 Tax=Pseudomonas aphyarum TaxID=2942629 RepID=A0ABT5PKK8_9PSED|nr:hypothetical protein [Pseudomonas aphyarum]MDD0968532.1 hypothetical protein [Pseudomonas aphyarum]MDD1124432.1 hypothetical protein [Pseudomonas aphyarum]
MKLKFFRRSAGYYPVIGEVFHDVAEVLPNQEGAQRYDLYVCSALGAIAQMPEDCDRMLAAISSIEEGLEAFICDGGNDVLLNMSADGVQVDILINDDWTGQPESRFELQEWRKILERWKSLLELPKGFDEILLLSLP